MALLAVTGCGSGSTDVARTEPDNTAVNERDAGGDMATPFDQSNSTEDTELVAKLRAEVLEIEDLSVNGRNIKIITNGGKVIVRGPVESDAERLAILKVVNGIAGEANVTSKLEVDED